MSNHYSLNDERADARRCNRDVLMTALYLVLLTLSVGLVLTQMGAGHVVYPSTPNRSADRQRDALVTAVETCDVATVRRLLRGGRVDVNGVDRVGLTPIYYALQARGPAAMAVLDALIEAGADVNGPPGASPPLVTIASFGRPDLVERLLRAGANPNGRTTTHWTALHYAAMCNDAATARLLLAAGADPAALDDEGRTPLEFTRTHDAHAVARLLTASASAARPSSAPLSGTTPTAACVGWSP
jgi:ankyrin repeat protein